MGDNVKWEAGALAEEAGTDRETVLRVFAAIAAGVRGGAVVRVGGWGSFHAGHTGRTEIDTAVAKGLRERSRHMKFRQGPATRRVMRRQEEVDGGQ